MVRFVLVASIILLATTFTESYAADEKPCLDKKLCIRTQAYNKNPEKLIPQKVTKTKRLSTPKAIPQQNNQGKSSSSADTFENLITPFLKVVSPHFYDQIIKRDKSCTSES